MKHYGSGHCNGADAATAMAVDDAGNIYVTGYLSAPPHGFDYYTVKYNAEGKQLWEARYDGPGGLWDMPVALALDQQGNVYVTGKSANARRHGGNYDANDFATIKYNNAGEQQWVARYNGTARVRDEAAALAIDKDSNVYVTGISVDVDGKADFVTIKYNSAGAQLWAARYDGSSHHVDTVHALAIDASGNVYVVGTGGTNYSANSVTIKYDSTGREVWQMSYELPEGGHAYARNLCLDEQGNVYVAGVTNKGVTTIKYNRTGTPQWIESYGTRIWDTVNGIALEKSGSLYVIGQSRGDYLTLKYDSSGVRKWAASYDRGQDYYDEATQLAFDGSGHVYVAGKRYFNPSAGRQRDFATIKYDSNGNTIWVAAPQYANANEINYREANAIAVDRSGNVYLAGLIGYQDVVRHDYLVQKYNANGKEAWTIRRNGQGSSDVATAMAVDAHGNIYITGESYSVTSNYDVVTLKYCANGELEWAKRYDSSRASDRPFEIMCDVWNNIYVSGLTYGFPANFFLIKYNDVGNEQWIINQGENALNAFAVDARSNVYLTGASTKKYGSNGVLRWEARRAGQNAQAIASDDSGNVYVAAMIWGDLVTIKYDSAGVEKWAARFSGAEQRYQNVGIALDHSDNVYLTVNTENNEKWLAHTIKYNPAGTKLWAVSHPGNRGSTIALDDSGNVYIMRVYPPLVKYNSDGVLQWTLQEKDLTGMNYFALEPSGGVYLAGTSNCTGPDPQTCDFGLAKYGRNGNREWFLVTSAPLKIPDAPTDIAVDHHGNVYLAGVSALTTYYTRAFDTWSNITTIKVTQSPSLRVRDGGSNQIKANALIQNHPNPFNPSTTIRYVLAQASRISLKIYNLAGQEVATLVDGDKIAGEHEIKWTPANLASGVYVYRLHAGDFVETKKLVLLQ